MKVLALVHEPDAGPGVFGDIARERGVALEEWRIAAGERCPAPPRSYDGVLTLGGAMHAFEHDRHPWLADEEALLAALVAERVPLLGVCLGAQVLARATGGDAWLMREPEVGWYAVEVSAAGARDPLIGPVGPRFEALQWHSCEISVPRDATSLATSERCLQAYRVADCAWGIQFHAEVTLADFEGWLDFHLAQPKAGDGPADPDGLRARTRASIAAWNEFGRGLFGRFLDRALAPRATS